MEEKKTYLSTVPSVISANYLGRRYRSAVVYPIKFTNTVLFSSSDSDSDTDDWDDKEDEASGNPVRILIGQSV